MPTRGLRRAASVQGFATPQNAPVYVDSDDNKLKFIPAGSGTTEVEVVDASSVQTLTNKTLTAPVLTGSLGTRSQEVLAATEVLVAADSGKTLFLAHATEFDTKLPAPAAGLYFRFVVALAPSGASYTITTNGTTQNVIHGVISSAEDALGSAANTSGTPVDVITFVDGKAQVGDWVELECDGTLWYVRGCCAQQDAITLA